MSGEHSERVQRGGAGADAGALRIGDGEGDGRFSDPAHALGPPQLPVVKIGLLGARGGEQDGVPSGRPCSVPNGETEAAP